MPGPALLSSLTQNSSSAQASAPVPTADPFASFNAFNSGPSTSQTNTPKPPAYQQSAFAPPPQQPADPFAALAAPRLNPQQTAPYPAPAPALAPAAAQASNDDDDEWNFSSSLPTEPSTLPREHRMVVSNTSLKIELIANRAAESAKNINLVFYFSNNTAQPISELHFQLAVTKVRDEDADHRDPILTHVVDCSPSPPLVSVFWFEGILANTRPCFLAGV